eukprot:CAMPEP_0203924950 /NCGR_PEP_ID=MMETSP0359-20131031/64664_1 /ASSEMBLY_ACC=CAM_ASM_000338 /TAXON_ID=268821 /ORGANISM="Scrippsiella Hangoei, Strain SHTV-5" /LENGTH=253 /DNA_ID=CAMNT_0050853275 /DNA_START=46 /DNA_END=807 /DNA_ORIENTATION=-
MTDDEIQSLLDPMASYCEEAYHQDLRRHGAPFVMNREMQRITGLGSVPEVIHHLRSVRIRDSDPIVQKLRRAMASYSGGSSNRIKGYHRTDGESAGQIMSTTFRCSDRGMLGKGIYFATKPEDVEGKAAHTGPVLECEVDVGRVKYVDSYARDLSRTTLASLNSEGYDCIYTRASRGGIVSRDEFCIFDPARVRVIGTMLSETPMDNIKMLGKCPGFNPFLTPVRVGCDKRGCNGMVDNRSGVCGACGRLLGS